MSDNINPEHYKRLPVEAIEIIESAIDNAPSAQDAYLHGQVLKYALRCWYKNGIEDLRKAKWYLDRLIEHCDESLIDLSKGFVAAWTCEDGKAKQVYPEPKWTPKVGDWVRIKKPKKDDHNIGIWFDHMDKYDGQIVQVSEIDEDVLIYGDGWGFLLDWLEPAEPPKEQPQPTDGWRWLEVGEVIRKGDKYFKDHKWYSYDVWVGVKIAPNDRPSIRRNRFEVGEKVVHVDDKESIVYVVNGTRGDGTVIVSCRNIEYAISPNKLANIEYAISPNKLAPYIEEAT